MELIRNTVYTADTAAKGMAQVMAEGDVIVPDTKPDVLKLIQVDSDAVIKDKYIENGKLILCGRVDYKILYVPDRENERMKSIETSMEFKQTVDASKADDMSQIIAKPTVERVEFNTLNSRKLHLRAIIHTDYEVCNMKAMEICTDVIDEKIEKKTEAVCFENVVNISEHEFTVKERIEIPSGERAMSEILKSDVKICDTEYKSLSGKIIVKGAMEMCVLYTDEDGEIKFTEAECPFTEVLDANEISEESICDIDYNILCVMTNIEPDIDGDLREIVIDIDVSAAIKATNTVEETILKDCYVADMSTKCATERIKLKTIEERPVSQNTIREIIDIPENIPRVSEVYNVMANAVVTKSQLDGNKIVCEGKVDAYILYLTDTKENPIYSFKKEIPFSYMIDCKCSAKALECQIKTLIKHTSYNLNSSGEIELRCNLVIECMLIKDTELENITEVSTEGHNGRQGIVIYFTQKGEDIWDIAKRYSVSCDSLKKLNNIDEDIITECCKLFIPI